MATTIEIKQIGIIKDCKTSECMIAEFSNMVEPTELVKSLFKLKLHHFFIKNNESILKGTTRC